MDKRRLILLLAAILLSIGVFALLGSPYVSMDFADAQYYDDDDDDDDDSISNRLIDGIFQDGRLNGLDVAASTVVYCENGSITLYSAIGRGNARVNLSQLAGAAATAIQTGQPVVVLESAAGRLDVFPNRTVRLLAPQSNSSTLYEFVFSLDACGTLNIVAAAPVVPRASGPVGVTNTGNAGTYTVLPGDTLTRIARVNNTSVNALVAANNIPNPDRIFVGQQLVIP
ncbi:MAG: LysM peptidoglycan-binding domain-containing protein [Chloroflexota bacterium]